MHSEQIKLTANQTISFFWLRLAASTLSPALIMPRPATISPTNTNVPEKTGGAASASVLLPWLWVTRASMPSPASRKPMDCTGKNIWPSAVKSQTPSA